MIPLVSPMNSNEKDKVKFFRIEAFKHISCASFCRTSICRHGYEDSPDDQTSKIAHDAMYVTGREKWGHTSLESVGSSVRWTIRNANATDNMVPDLRTCQLFKRATISKADLPIGDTHGDLDLLRVPWSPGHRKSLPLELPAFPQGHHGCFGDEIAVKYAFLLLSENRMEFDCFSWVVPENNSCAVFGCHVCEQPILVWTVGAGLSPCPGKDGGRANALGFC